MKRGKNTNKKNKSEKTIKYDFNKILRGDFLLLYEYELKLRNYIPSYFLSTTHIGVSHHRCICFCFLSCRGLMSEGISRRITGAFNRFPQSAMTLEMLLTLSFEARIVNMGVTRMTVTLG